MHPGIISDQRAMRSVAPGTHTMALVAVTQPERMAFVIPAQTLSLIPKSSALTMTPTIQAYMYIAKPRFATIVHQQRSDQEPDLR